MLKNTNSPVIVLLLFLCIILQSSSALKCRSEDGPSEAELKRITRSCMRKVSENSHFNGGNSNGGSSNGGGGGGADGNNNGFGNNGYNGASNTNFHYPSSNGYHYNSNSNSNSNNNNKNNNNYGQQSNYRSTDYDSDSDEDSDVSENGYNAGGGGRDVFQQRHRERNPILNNRNGGNGGNNGNSNTGGRSNGNSNSNTGNSNSNNNSGNQRNSNQKSYNNGRSNPSSQGNKRGDNNRNNGTSYDTGCVVHCFFEELSTLNKDDYPDKHKVIYMLTKDIRDRELRNFYTDTIQSCFRYMDSQRRREKCQFSRELIQCMAEHAKANCDDWEEYNVMFN